jgi:hypothetical protein
MITALYLISELQAFLIACYYYRYLRGSFMRWFVPFLAFIFFADAFLYVRLSIFHLEYSVTINYLQQLAQTFFYGYLFSKMANKRVLTRLVFFMWVICMPGLMLSFFLSQNSPTKNMLVIAIVSNMFNAVISLGYLYLHIIKNDSIRLLHEPGWWLATGVSVFFSCVSIGYLLYDFILQNKLRLFGIYLYNLIPRFMSLILYSFISIGIILYATKAKQKSALE